MHKINDYLVLIFILIGIAFVIGGLFSDRFSRTPEPADYYDWRNEMQ